MMIATILLVVSFIIFLVKGTILFSFWHFLWIYPVEIIFWILVNFLFILGFKKAVGWK